MVRRAEGKLRNSQSLRRSEERSGRGNGGGQPRSVDCLHIQDSSPGIVQAGRSDKLADVGAGLNLVPDEAHGALGEGLAVHGEKQARPRARKRGMSGRESKAPFQFNGSSALRTLDAAQGCQSSHGYTAARDTGRGAARRGRPCSSPRQCPRTDWRAALAVRLQERQRWECVTR